MKECYLTLVSIENNNKYYNLKQIDNDTFRAEFGRVGARCQTKNYPMYKWDSVIKSKIRKGYKDITELKKVKTVIAEKSNNLDFQEFYNHFSQYITNAIKTNYQVNGATKSQMLEAQKVLNNLNNLNNIGNFNRELTSLFEIIPRSMKRVQDFLAKDNKDINKIIQREQDALDAMDSSNITQTVNILETLGVTFEEVKDISEIDKLLSPTNTSYYKIHKVYKVINKITQNKFDESLKLAKDKTTKLLIHGTRNPNILSIMKQGLLIRPSNAAYISGAAYGNGVYHSAHTDKSLGYTGRDTDAIFFIQDVHMGKHYEYSGWYYDNKDISRSQMSKEGLSKLGYDSLYVKAGDGLLNSEYIVYEDCRTTIKYIVWMK